MYTKELSKRKRRKKRKIEVYRSSGDVDVISMCGDMGATMWMCGDVVVVR